MYVTKSIFTNSTDNSQTHKVVLIEMGRCVIADKSHIRMRCGCHICRCLRPWYPHITPTHRLWRMQFVYEIWLPVNGTGEQHSNMTCCHCNQFCVCTVNRTRLKFFFFFLEEMCVRESSGSRQACSTWTRNGFRPASRQHLWQSRIFIASSSMSVFGGTSAAKSTTLLAWSE